MDLIGVDALRRGRGLPVVEVSRFQESDSPGAGSLGFFEACNSGVGSFLPESVCRDSGIGPFGLSDSSTKFDNIYLIQIEY